MGAWVGQLQTRLADGRRRSPLLHGVPGRHTGLPAAMQPASLHGFVMGPIGCPSAPPQLVQGKLADMYAATQATRALVYATAREADAGKPVWRDCCCLSAKGACRCWLHMCERCVLAPRL